MPGEPHPTLPDAQDARSHRAVRRRAGLSRRRPVRRARRRPDTLPQAGRRHARFWGCLPAHQRGEPRHGRRWPDGGSPSPARVCTSARAAWGGSCALLPSRMHRHLSCPRVLGDGCWLPRWSQSASLNRRGRTPSGSRRRRRQSLGRQRDSTRTRVVLLCSVCWCEGAHEHTRLCTGPTSSFVQESPAPRGGVRRRNSKGALSDGSGLGRAT